MKQYHRFSSTALLLVLSGLLAGCDEPRPRPVIGQHQSGCQTHGCGHNGPDLADWILGALSIDGFPNDRQLALVGARDRYGQEIGLALDSSGLVGVDLQTGAREPAPADLEGATLLIQDQSAAGRYVEWWLTIDQVTDVSYWSSQSGATPGYRLSLAPSHTPEERTPLCPGGGEALVIVGEHYDDETLDIIDLPEHTDADAWFRFACESHLLWKSRKMSYDPSLPPGHAYYTTPAERRATIAMLAADYCGDGQRFTRTGVGLFWQNDRGWMDVGAPGQADTVIEAAWDEHGAICLDTPRLYERYRRADIEEACGRAIPTCDDSLLAQGKWLTYLPAADQ